MKKFMILLFTSIITLLLITPLQAQNYLIDIKNDNYSVINISQRISKFSAQPLWNLNYEQIKRIIDEYKYVQEIKTIIIYDRLINQHIIIANFNNGKITFIEDGKAPEESILDTVVKEKIHFNTKHIGDVIIYLHNQVKGYSLSLNNNELKFIQKNPVLKVSNELDWPPFDFAIDSKPEGYFIDLLRIISHKTGLKFELINGYTWDELYNKFVKKEIDLVHPVSKTKLRQKDGIFSIPAYSYGTVFAIRKTSNEVQSIQDLKGQKVAIGKGFALEEYLTQNHPEINYVLVNSIKQGLELLSQGKVNALIDSEPVIRYLIRKNFFDNIKISSRFQEYIYKESAKLHFMTHRDNPELISIINKTLKTITPGELSLLEKKWFGKNKENLNQNIELSNKELAYLNNKKEILMCSLTHAMPYEGIDENGFHSGIAEDFIKLFEQRIGYPIKLYRTTSWAKSHEAIQQDLCDILPLAQKTKQRSDYLNFTPSFLNQTTVIATRNEELFVNSLDEVKNKKIAIVKNYAHAHLIQEQYPQLEIIRVDDIKEGLDKVRKKEIYGYIDALGSIGYELQKQGSYDIKVAGKIGFNLALSTATRKNEPLLDSIFTKAVESLSQDEIQTIYNKWISVKFEQEMDYTFVYQIIIAGCFIVGLMFIWNRKLKAEIRKRIIIEEQLKIAQQKAVDANEAKSQFLANMTHDIRTPMNGILGMNNLALQILHEDPNQAKDYIVKSQSSAQILLGIINDILDFSKIEAGKLDIDFTPMSLREMISQLNDMFNYQCQEKQLQFVIEQDELLPEYIIGDQLRLAQVLSNLIGNALKFTNEGSIKLKIELLHKSLQEIELQFSVIDTGKGIEKAYLPKLFESFTQENNTISQDYGGTGLGLAICKQLITLMHGDIHVQSEIDQGSTFYFTIKTQLVDETTVKQLEAEKKAQAIRVEKEKLPCKILLVEDNEINKELACKFLEEIVEEIDVAMNGKEAVDKIFTEEYALVLMDIHMPIMDGYTATKHVRANKKYAKLPIVAMTANALKSDVKKCLDVGMNDHIAKPFSVLELNQKIRKWANQELCHHEMTMEHNNDNKRVTASNTLDSTTAIERMIGRKDLYTDFLNQFLAVHTNDFKKAIILLEDGKKEESEHTIHTLKGMVKTMGAENLGDMLQNLELKIKKDQNIKKDIKIIEKELTLVISEVKKFSNHT